MEKFYLEEPSIKRKSEIIDYLNEFVEYNSPLNGCGFLSKIFDGYTFEQALNETLNMKNEDFAKKYQRCQSKTFLLIRSNDNKIVGSINIRWNLPESMKQFSGNIGYGIRPKERGKGYNKINLYLGLLEMQKLGLNKITLSCEATNIASYKTMQALGGILEKTEIDPSDGIFTKVYCFNINECIEKYKDTYKDFI